MLLQGALDGKLLLPPDAPKLLEVVPVAFLPDNYALTVAAMSYNGALDFSLLGDYDIVLNDQTYSRPADWLAAEFNRRVTARQAGS